MRPGEEELVRVTADSELAAGMTVYTRPCKACGKHDWRMIVRRVGLYAGAPTWVVLGGCGLAVGQPSGTIRPASELPFSFHRSISEGRLYRLRDLDDSAPATTTRQQTTKRPATAGVDS